MCREPAMTDSAYDLAIRGARLYRCDGSGSPSARLRVEERGAIGFRHGQIAYVGPDRDLVAAETIHANGDAALPGLVDCHTHLVFAGSRVGEFARRMNGEDYRAIAASGGGIMATVRATRDADDDTLFRASAARARAMRSRGTTTIEIKSGYGLTIEHEMRQLAIARKIGSEGILRVSTSYLGAHTVPVDRKGERHKFVEEVVRALPEIAARGLADACDIYIEEGAFDLDESRRILSAAVDAGLRIRGHAGQFSDLGGPELLSELGALSADHLEHVSDEGLERMAAQGVVAVLLPGAWRTLRQTPPRAERLRKHGVRIAVATDCNPGTSPTLDLPLCAALAVRDAGLTPEEAILAVTTEAAVALNLQDRIGQLREGYDGDCILLPSSDGRAIAYAMGGLEPRVVIRNGEVVHRADSRDVVGW